MVYHCKVLATGSYLGGSVVDPEIFLSDPLIRNHELRILILLGIFLWTLVKKCCQKGGTR